jgi:integrase
VGADEARLHRTGGGPLGWRSIQHLTTTVRKLLRHECELGWLESVPELRPPPNRLVRQEQAPRRAYSRAERERFLGAIKTPFPRSFRFYTVLFFSLLRRGELWALTPRWIDFAGERIRIPATDSKSGEAEEIDMHPRAAKALRAELRSRRGIALDEPLFGKHDAREAFRHGLAKGKIDPHGWCRTTRRGTPGRRWPARRRRTCSSYWRPAGGARWRWRSGTFTPMHGERSGSSGDCDRSVSSWTGVFAGFCGARRLASQRRTAGAGSDS